MSKTLIIAEKPSVATELSKVFARAPGMSKFKSHGSGDYFENDTHVISSTIGHLVEIEKPTEGGKSMAWSMEKLPIMPEHFDLKPISKTRKRFNLLKKLMKRKDITALVNACDAGREGELIFRYLIEAAAVDKPITRLWMQSMTAKSLIEAFAHQRSDGEMIPLASAARCRSESDWLVGINSTRALTAFRSRHGGFQLTPVGRVQTPTLAILVKREGEILAFRARTFYEIHGDFHVEAGTYPGRWFREGFKKGDDGDDRAERIWDEEEARKIAERCRGREGVVEETRKPKKQAPPLLYDLTSLQRDASNRFGYSARRTLQVVQSLYERHKAVTYPRTDSRFLPEDYPPAVRDTLRSLAKGGGALDTDTAAFAGRAVEENLVKGGNKRIFNDSKVSDHFAIIPTGKVPGKSLSEAERKIYDAVVRRFIAAFYGSAEFLVTTRITRIDADAFKTEGKVLVEPGWMAVRGRRAANGTGGRDGEGELVPWKEGESALAEAVEVEENATKPPPRFNEATLLSAMEGAGKLVEDEELRAAMSERGLGTPATRAAIIEGLIHDKYVQRHGRNLVASNKGIGLIEEIEAIGLDVLCAPELTGDWEFKLKQIEHGRLGREEFMEDIRGMTAGIVNRIGGYMAEVREKPFPDLDAPCPVCGASPLTQDDTFYSCPSKQCRFRVGKKVASRPMSEDEIRILVTEKTAGPFEGFRTRTGELFTATLAVDENGKVSFVSDRDDDTKPELGDPVAECPLCRETGRTGTVHEVAAAFVCENFYEEPKCGARLPKHLLRKEISRENAERFFRDGKTAVIEGFISKKGRPFSASLKLKTKGDKLFDWDFPPRVRRGKKSAAGASGKKPDKA